MPDRVREDPMPFVDDVVIAIDRILTFTSGIHRRYPCSTLGPH
ncbi:hypothetical protein ASZ90_014736 [hydrocarbon metagenome]|uniref:Uncharacterized protein n=1 Tax=hydrocarbon metagenome TaxID=938273 RepID=A0A0W8F412_9ZZZZ